MRERERERKNNINKFFFFLRFYLKVFSHANVFFSIGGRQFSNNPVYYSYIPDLLMEHARNVTIKLHHRLGRFVKLRLDFANRWLLLSEVKFDSGKFLRTFQKTMILYFRQRISEVKRKFIQKVSTSIRLEN